MSSGYQGDLAIGRPRCLLKTGLAARIKKSNFEEKWVS